MENLGVDAAFWSDRRVLLTGHTGFKGAWLALWLESLGARVYAIALPSPTAPNVHSMLFPSDGVAEMIADIRDTGAMARAVAASDPEVIFHLAAQSLVLAGIADPVETFSTNVVGTSVVLEAARRAANLKAVVVVTSDKVYRPGADDGPHSEDDHLGGHDPYSASKAAAEHVVEAYSRSYFRDRSVAVATARAGNVIGGGDWAADRLIPDAVRAWAGGRAMVLRNPRAVRPWQHVFEALRGYLVLAQKLVREPIGAPYALNFGPNAEDSRMVGEVAEMFGRALGGRLRLEISGGGAVSEIMTLRLNVSAAAAAIGWQPVLSLAQALDMTAAWYRAWRQSLGMREFSISQIRSYLAQTARSPGNADQILTRSSIK